ncbi:MAG: MFS transporter [Candidatus Hodarchaeota archaeon]
MLIRFLLNSNRFKLNSEAIRFVRRAVLLTVGYSVIHWLTQTFIVLYALQYLTWIELGIVLAVQIGIQIILDYPTGTIGDWIGQRWVMVITSIFYASFFFTFSLSRTFEAFFWAYIILGFARAQESGALAAWYQNNYKLYAPEDEDRTIFSYLQGKWQTFSLSLQASAFVFGGFMINIYGRSILFFVQSILFSIYLFLFTFFMFDHPELKRKELNLRDYYKLLGAGLKTAVNNTTLRWMILGSIIFNIGVFIWVNFMLFPLYQDYGKTDDVIGSLRAIIFLTGVGVAWLSAIIAGRWRTQQAKKVLAFTEAFTWPIFFLGIILMLEIFPPQISFNIGLVFILIVIMRVAGCTQFMQNILRSRFFLDIIPDENRNSIFSLIPTLTLIATIPTNIFAGVLLDSLTRIEVVILLLVITLVGGMISGFAVLRHSPDTVQ